MLFLLCQGLNNSFLSIRFVLKTSVSQDILVTSHVISIWQLYQLKPSRCLESILWVNLLFLSNHSTNPYLRIHSWYKFHYGNFILCNHFFNQGICALPSSCGFLFVREYEIRVFYIMINLKTLSRFETNQFHSIVSKIFDLFHFILVDSDFFSSERIILTNLVSIQGLPCFFTNQFRGCL